MTGWLVVGGWVAGGLVFRDLVIGRLLEQHPVDWILLGHIVADVRGAATVRGESIVVTESASDRLRRALDAVVAATAPGDSVAIGAAVLVAITSVRGFVQAAEAVVVHVTVDAVALRDVDGGSSTSIGMRLESRL